MENNLKIVEITKLMQENKIPMAMIRNRNIDPSKSVAEIFSDVQSEYHEIETFIQTGKQKDMNDALTSVNKWGASRESSVFAYIKKIVVKWD